MSSDNILLITKESSHRQKVAQLVYSIWTHNDNAISGLASPWLDGRIDTLGQYVTLRDYDLLSIDCSTSKNDDRVVEKISMVDGNKMTYDDFVTNYMSQNKPVLIDKLAEDWNIQKEWITNNNQLDISEVCKMFGDDIVPVHIQKQHGLTLHRPEKIEMNVFQYLQWWEKRHEANGVDDEENSNTLLYLKDWKFVLNHPHIKKYLYTCPNFFEDDWLNDTFDKSYKFIYLGPKGTSTQLHADVLSSFSWSANIFGRKRWYLIPPQYTFLLKDVFGRNLAPQIHADAGLEYTTLYPGLPFINEYNLSMRIIQNIGETLFVPSEWHHTVENLEDTLSINHNWINSTNIHWIWNKIKHRTHGDLKVLQADDDLSRLWLIVSKKAKMITEELLSLDNEGKKEKLFINYMHHFNTKASLSPINDLLVILPILEWIHGLLIGSTTTVGIQFDFLELFDIELLLSRVRVCIQNNI